MSKKKRSWLMSRIRGKDTGIEKTMRSAMRKAGLKGWAYQPKMAGRPDFAFRKERVAIFCDGDFWHGYRFERKKSRMSLYWKKKIEGNMARDARNRKALRHLGWRVVRLWEHEIEHDLAGCVGRIKKVKNSPTTKSGG